MSSRPGKQAGILKLLWPYLRPQLPTLLLTLLLSLLIATLAAAQPLLTRLAIDAGLIGRHYDQLLAACLGMLALALAGMILGGVHRALYVRASGRVLFALRGATYRRLLQVSPRRLAEHAVGDLVTRLDGDVAEVQRFGTDSAAAFVSSALTLCLVGAVMLQLSWRMTLVMAALLPLQLIVRHYARARIERSTRAVREQASRVSGFLIETLGNARTVQAAAAEAAETERLGKLGDGYLSRVVRAQMVAYATGSATGLLGHIATAATFLLGGWYVLHGALSLGTLIAFVAYLGRIAASAASLSGLYTGYQRARVSLERVRQLQALPVVTEADATASLGPEARGALRFEDLTIRLPRDGRVLLDGVSAEIPAGTKLLLRGASGAGKTTIADLLRRFVDADSGRILLDGIPLGQIQLQELRRRIVVVEHSPVLFRGTILDNLRYGHPTVNESAVLQAAILARVDEFVQDLPDGYLTQVGEGGASLSTGQRQRIALARASLADPLVVILDEALSGLDHDNAVAVQRALDNSFPQRTRIVITHRDTTIENVDLCWVLDAGALRSEPAGA